MVHHLPQYKSDHRPLLVKFSSQRRPNRHRRPFRFEAAWLTHEHFDQFLRNTWDHYPDWVPRMQHFQQAVKDWNKNTFGNIFIRKREILRRLNGISRALARGPNDFLENVQSQLWDEYEAMVVREEILWFQKSRCKWLAFGDKNSKYFHGITKIRRRKNFFAHLAG